MHILEQVSQGLGIIVGDQMKVCMRKATAKGGVADGSGSCRCFRGPNIFTPIRGSCSK
jgi:hypothetical protein